MAIERRDNDKQVEELRGDANAVEAKVRLITALTNSYRPFLYQMAEHLKKSEGELNELLADYWKLRHETGIYRAMTLVARLFVLLDVYMETLANKLNMRVTFL